MEGKNFYLDIEGQLIEVSEEVYHEYKRAEEKEQYFMKRLKKGHFIADSDNQKVTYIPSREQSYDKLLELNWEFSAQGESVEDTVLNSYLLEKLNIALHTLTDNERILINELFYLEKSEREVCAALNMAKTTLHHRKKRILEKLRKEIEKK